jgi:outer membrane protein TolC
MKANLFCFLLFLAPLLQAPLLRAQYRYEGAMGFDHAVDLAMANSAELRAAYANRALREGSWILGVRAYLPQLSLSLSEDDRLSLVSTDSFLKNYTLNVDQLVWDGGRTGMSRKIERMELSLLADEAERQASELAESVLGAYRQILYARMIIAIKEGALDSLREQQRILARELALGLVIPLQLKEGELTVKIAEMELLSLTIELEETERGFAQILGLTELPELAETIDVYRSPPSLDAELIRQSVLAKNIQLASMRHGILQKQAEAKLASSSWLPSLKATGSFTLSGQRYPLNHYSWSMGLSVQFNSPWFSASTGGNLGWERPYDKTARAQGSFSPLPDPVSALSVRQAELALALERENLKLTTENMGRAAVLGVQKIVLSEQKRVTALKALVLAEEKYRLQELLLDLGRITRVELMEERLTLAQKETAAVEAALALLTAERELEGLLNIKPGILKEFSARRETKRIEGGLIE